MPTRIEECRWKYSPKAPVRPSREERYGEARAASLDERAVEPCGFPGGGASSHGVRRLVRPELTPVELANESDGPVREVNPHWLGWYLGPLSKVAPNVLPQIADGGSNPGDAAPQYAANPARWLEPALDRSRAVTEPLRDRRSFNSIRGEPRCLPEQGVREAHGSQPVIKEFRDATLEVLLGVGHCWLHVSQIS